jgi:hypothetical protein
MEISDFFEDFDTEKGFAEGPLRRAGAVASPLANETRLAKIKRTATERDTLSSDMVAMVWTGDNVNEYGMHRCGSDGISL